MKTRATPRRLGTTVAVAFGAVVAFAAIGGTGFAGSVVKPSKAQYGPGQYQNPGKVTVCHKGKVTIRISMRALPAHQAHGDQVLTCAAVTAKAKAKAAAKQAAKANAAKANAQAKADKQQEKAAKKAGESAASSSTVSTPGNGNGKAKGKNK
ncbi:MAG TPA: hypothetical protein VFN99_05860 [Gaiella sp.]|nr:hypothetical protein [Gaiella sp.]